MLFFATYLVRLARQNSLQKRVFETNLKKNWNRLSTYTPLKNNAPNHKLNSVENVELKIVKTKNSKK